MPCFIAVSMGPDSVILLLVIVLFFIHSFPNVFYHLILRYQCVPALTYFDLFIINGSYGKQCQQRVMVTTFCATSAKMLC